MVQCLTARVSWRNKEQFVSLSTRIRWNIAHKHRKESNKTLQLLLKFTKHFSIYNLQVWSEKPGEAKDFTGHSGYFLLFSQITPNPGTGSFFKYKSFFSETCNRILNLSCWRRNTTRTWAPRVHSCPEARNSALPSPGQSSVTPRSCCWTRPPLPWTPRARRYAWSNSSLLSLHPKSTSVPGVHQHRQHRRGLLFLSSSLKSLSFIISTLITT